ncbi:arylsulfatase [Maioricimonas sp. JC845]|uniref:arylsulfatase n=1 Tax=Maioricimonas sp. JC845 TaxID=3232138 RepID=UPI00345B072F
MRMHRFLIVCSLLLASVVTRNAPLPAAPPNVVLVMTDDQGYGDIGALGNEMIDTPNLDRLYGESVRLTNYHVDPTCSPTRSALMTGRYSTRTGVWHTIMGRSMMNTDELTMAEVFAANGYRTGMFGKWHLGDTYPLRPQDQGFQTVRHHGGGGVGQTPDDWGNDYFDDTYRHEDGTPEQFTGYCTDVWFDEALAFIEASQDKPFFCYLTTNAPHGPYLVEPSYKQPYLDAGVPEPMASFYGMITNIDENMGRLVARLDELGLAENTILIFTTDNGTAAGVARGRQQQNAKWKGYNAGMRGQKGSEYDGGHRVPFFVRWPAGGLEGGRDVEQLAAHIDVLPTLVDLCGIEKPEGPPVDGTSLVRALEGNNEILRDRTLFVHSQRIESPEKWRKSAVMTERWRLINGKELYDIQADPGQESNVASANPQVVAQLRDAYEQWWASLSPVFDEHVRIVLGADEANPTNFTCHDWHAPQQQVPWHHGMIARNPEANGYWMVEVREPGTYEFRLRMRPSSIVYGLPAGTAKVRVGDVEETAPVEANAPYASVTIELDAGPEKLQTWLDGEDGTSRGAFFVEARRVE